jgi:hypothetical protein
MLTKAAMLFASMYRQRGQPSEPGGEALIRGMESRVELSITDYDYRTSDTPTFLVELRVAA